MIALVWRYEVLEEARAVKERLQEARPASQPLKVSDEERPEAPKRRAKQASKAPRTQGRKTTPLASATAPRRATARPGGFQAKRGQKHEH